MKAFGEFGKPYGVQEGVAADLGRATARVVNVVALHGDHIVRYTMKISNKLSKSEKVGSLTAGQVDRPVVVAIASSRPGRRAVDLGVGDAHTSGCVLSEDCVEISRNFNMCICQRDHSPMCCLPILEV
jgi:hypothetical protein